jgi:hypothetical protein
MAIKAIKALLPLLGLLGLPFIILTFANKLHGSAQHTLNYTFLTLHNITPDKKEIYGSNDRLYLGTGGAACAMKSSQKESNIEFGSNKLTGFTLAGFAKSFSLKKPITCLKLEITYKGKLFTTGDINITKSGMRYVASPHEITWDFTKTAIKDAK